MFKNNQFNRLELLLLSLLYQKDLECFEICKLINIQSKESFHPKNAILFTTLYHFENSLLFTLLATTKVLRHMSVDTVKRIL